MTTNGSRAALNGRRAEAARNDQAILEAARAVFVADPGAPIVQVAHTAGVGVGALYRRYGNKEGLLQRLCAEGLRTFIALAEQALGSPASPQEALEAFVRGVIEADVHSLTVSLAGTFTPTDELRQLSARAEELGSQLFDRALAAGAVRSDLTVDDLSMIFEQVTAVRVGDPQRTRELRRRYVALALDGLRPEAACGPLPGPPPSTKEIGERWIQADTRH